MVSIPFIGGDDYPVTVHVRARRNDKNKRKTLRGRRIKEEDKGFIYELSNGEKTQPVPYEAIDVDGDGQPVVDMVSPSPGEYVPLTEDLDEEKLEAVVDKAGAKAFRKNRYNKARQFYQRKSLLERYQAPITIVIFAIAFMLMSAGMVRFFDGLAGQFADQIAEAVGTAAASASG